MKQIVVIVSISLLFLFSCSSGKKALERGDYYSAISKAVDRLQNNPDNRNAIHVLKEGYPMAIDYYQEQIDLILSGTDRFKWVNTVHIMERINDLAEQIRRIPAARKLVESPKVYTTEMRPAKEKAAEELYLAGLEKMEEPNKENARQAYLYFTDADELIPGYKEVNSYIRESKSLATYIVIVEKIPVHCREYALSSSAFYDRLMTMLRYNFPQKGFVNFYTDEEAGRLKIEHPDMVLKMNFYDFYIGEDRHSETEQPLSKTVEEQVKISKRDTVVYQTVQHTYRGTIKIINDQLLTQGMLKVDVLDFLHDDQILMNDNIPGQFGWSNSYAVFVGDKEVLEANQIALLNNYAYPPPPPQDLFLEMTKPIFDQLSNRLLYFFREYARN